MARVRPCMGLYPYVYVQGVCKSEMPALSPTKMFGVFGQILAVLLPLLPFVGLDETIYGEMEIAVSVGILTEHTCRRPYI
jgi:hypothetical protein